MRAVILMLCSALMISLPLLANSTVPKEKSEVLVTVKGTAVSIHGKPLANVKGECQNPSSGMLGPNWTSGADGTFILKLKPGPYKIWAYGARSKEITFTASPDDAGTRVTVISSPNNKLLLEFRRPNGKPLTNATVIYGVLGGRGFVKVGPTGCVGAPTQGYLPFHAFFVLAGVGYADVNVTDEETMFGDNPLVVRLHGGQYVSGRVVGESNGLPLGGVKVYPSRQPGKGDPWGWWNTQYGFKSYPYTVGEPMSATSRDGDGVFKVGPLPPGSYEFHYGVPAVGGNASIAERSEPVSVAPGKDMDGVQLHYPLKWAAYSLEGQLLQGTTSKLLASTEATISVMGDYPPNEEPEEWYVWEPVDRRVVTDARGNFRLYPIRPGKYRLEAKWGKLSAKKAVVIRSNVKGVEFLLK